MSNDEFSLAVSYYNAGAFDQAAPIFRRLAKLNPRHFAVWLYWGVTSAQMGDDKAAVKRLSKAISLKPSSPEAYNNLGLSLSALGRFSEAIKQYRKALALKPDYVEALNNLGQILTREGKAAEAEQLLRRAVALAPTSAVIRNNLGLACLALCHVEEAVAAFRAAVDADADYSTAWNGLGMALKWQGHVPEAIDAFREALTNHPRYHEAASNLLFCANYSSAMSAADLRREACELAKLFEGQALPAQRKHTNQPTPDRRLRIGYVSPDFREHSVAYFLEPVLNAHDRAAYEIFCYAQVPKPDAVTARIRKMSDHWCDSVGMDHSALASRVTADGIDILVDLAGHTGGNRLPVFTWRPAPVQITWLGYCGTTGLPTIDYRLSDAIADPEGEDHCTEQLLRLPNGFLCYAPPVDAPEIAPPPALDAGFVTFGSFNVLSKMTPEVVSLWSQILKEVPRSRLLLKSKWLAEQATAGQVAARFAAHGVDRSRLALMPRIEDTKGHLGAYGGMDIALDPFPYNGTTTTCEALWMGRPVVALRGDRHAARVGASILTHTGLEHLIAGSAPAYVEKAVALAKDPQALQAMAPDIRQAMQENLCDANVITGDIEAAYREIWRTWCAEQA